MPYLEDSFFSTEINGFIFSLIPVVTYLDPGISKDEIIKENRGKAGIYRWVNKENGNSYVGSSVNLSRRLGDYFYKYKKKESERRWNMVIYRALWKHGPSGFRLEILEYCDPKDVIIREQYHLDTLKPIYNNLGTAYSNIGYKHTEKAIDKMKAAHLGRIVSDETKAKLRKNLMELNTRKAFSMEVINTETKIRTMYPSIREVAKALNTNHTTVRNYIKSKKLFKNLYLFRLI